MANRNKNGTKFTNDIKRGRRVKGPLAVRALQRISIETRKLAVLQPHKP